MKDVPGFEGLYAVTKDGKVWSYPRRTHKKGRFLKPILKNGYFSFKLQNKPQPIVDILAHRLVALTYLPKPKAKPFINHKNGIKTDNRLGNLEWCTQKENVAHALANMLTHPRKGTEVNTAKLSEEDVREIRKLHKYQNFSLAQLSKIYGTNYSNIGHVIRRFTWKHI